MWPPEQSSLPCLPTCRGIKLSRDGGTSANDEAIRPLGPPVLAGLRRSPKVCSSIRRGLSNTHFAAPIGGGGVGGAITSRQECRGCLIGVVDDEKPFPVLADPRGVGSSDRMCAALEPLRIDCRVRCSRKGHRSRPGPRETVLFDAALAPCPAGASGNSTATAPDHVLNIEFACWTGVDAFLDLRL